MWNLPFNQLDSNPSKTLPMMERCISITVKFHGREINSHLPCLTRTPRLSVWSSRCWVTSDPAAVVGRVSTDLCRSRYPVQWNTEYFFLLETSDTNRRVAPLSGKRWRNGEPVHAAKCVTSTRVPSKQTAILLLYGSWVKCTDIRAHLLKVFLGWFISWEPHLYCSGEVGANRPPSIFLFSSENRWC